MQRSPFLERVIGMRVETATATDEEIYSRHRQELMRFARILVGPDQAGDVLSSVIVRILSKRHLSDLNDPRPYLYRAVLNEAHSFHRTQSHLNGLVPESIPSNPAPPTDPQVLEAVAALPPRQRAAVYLVYWEGCTPTEAAGLMHARPGTVRRYLHLARQHLRGVLDESAA